MNGIAALPRSSLHLAFLKANESDVDHVLYRDAHIGEEVEQWFPGRAVNLGREVLPFAHPLAALRQIAANRRYYAQVREQLAPLQIERMILFLEGEPLERMLTDWFEGPVELWEDGLSHYVDLTGRAWYAGRGAVQALCGFYPRRIFRRRADRSKMFVRDRFERQNLVLPPPLLAPSKERILLIGSPLVEDGLNSRRSLQAGVMRLAAAADVPICYLPHPREDCRAVAAMIADLAGVTLAPEPWGLHRHVAEHGYSGFIAPVSTGLLDLAAFDRSLFVPRLFGQERMHHALTRWAANPVALASRKADLKSFFSRLRGPPVTHK